MKILTLLTALALTLFAVPMTARGEALPDISYTIINGEAVITGCSGETESLSIPGYIEGRPVTSVRDNAFYACTSLKRIKLPETVTVMGHHCFYGCTSLEEAVLPSSLKKIGMGCFYGCTSLTEIAIPDTLELLPDSCFRNCTSLKKVFIPQSVTKVEKFCFCGCDSLRYVSFSGRTKAIGIGAFYMCGALDTVYIPPSVEEIGIEALGFAAEEKRTGLTIIGSKDSAAADYSSENGIVFSEAPDSVAVFDPADSMNAPVKLPKPLAAAGGILFMLSTAAAIVKGLRQRREK